MVAFGAATSGAGVDTVTTGAAAGTAARGGATTRNPASVFTIGDIGADSQSSPSNTLPSAIAATAP